jgi:hypothetical protein
MDHSGRGEEGEALLQVMAAARSCQ